MSEVKVNYGRPRYASAQEAAGVAAECAQIIRRNEAETATRRDLMAHARTEIERHLSLDRGVEQSLDWAVEQGFFRGGSALQPSSQKIHASDGAAHNEPALPAGESDCDDERQAIQVTANES